MVAQLGHRIINYDTALNTQFQPSRDDTGQSRSKSRKTTPDMILFQLLMTRHFRVNPIE